MMPFVQSGSAAIYWKLEGRDDAPALVLLNSIGTDMDLWAETLPALRRHFALLRIDTRGHGASSAPEGDYRLDQLARDVMAVMDTAGIHRAAIAGVSLGGMIAMELALSAPERIAGLALVCTSATMDPASWDARIAAVRQGGTAAIADLAMGRFLSPAFVAERPEVEATIRRGLISMAASGYAGCGAAIRDMDLQQRLRAIAATTLIITGTRDTSTPFAGHGEHLLAHIPGAVHRALDAAHLAPIEVPDALAAALINHFG